MTILENRIHIFTGHFGSGKTELAINFAGLLRDQYEYVAIDDLDIINPYFRTRDAIEFFNEKGIELIAPPKKLIQADLPIVSAEIYRVLGDAKYRVVVDAGGDKDGAKALGQYHHDWKDLKPEVIFVLNANRPYVSTLDGALYTISEIEKAARMPITSIINNTNIGKITTLDDIKGGLELSLLLSEKLNIPLMCTTIASELKMETAEFAADNCVQYINRFMKVAWE